MLLDYGLDIAMDNLTGVALEGMSLATQHDIRTWMTNTFGPESKTTWHVEHDYDLRNLMFTREIATMVYLRWGHVL